MVRPYIRRANGLAVLVALLMLAMHFAMHRPDLVGGMFIFTLVTLAAGAAYVVKLVKRNSRLSAYILALPLIYVLVHYVLNNAGMVSEFSRNGWKSFPTNMIFVSYEILIPILFLFLVILMKRKLVSHA
jgi:hypothetical protein